MCTLLLLFANKRSLSFKITCVDFQGGLKGVGGCMGFQGIKQMNVNGNLMKQTG